MNRQLLSNYAKHRNIAEDVAERDIFSVVQKVARNLAPKYIFGYNTIADIEQDAFVIALEVLEEEDAYDPSRPLENFLYVHLKRRLTNNIRDNFYRGEPPCQCCNVSTPREDQCKKWVEWGKRNTSKQNLMKPVDVSIVNHEAERNMSTDCEVIDDAISNEILELIDRELPVNLRADYLRMRSHVVIPKIRRKKVREAILGLLEPVAEGHSYAL